jgi:CxxC-x17-CxxC domain-containing protein
VNERPIKSPDGRQLADQLIASARSHIEASLYALADRRFGEFALSAGIAVEHLCKAVLCEVHPTLIAENRDLHSLFGVLGLSQFSPEKGKPVRTIGARDAVERCVILYEEFASQGKHLRKLIDLRNDAAHIGSGPEEPEHGNVAAYRLFLLTCCDVLTIAIEDLTGTFASALQAVCSDFDTGALRVCARVAAHRERFTRLVSDYPEIMSRTAPDVRDPIGVVTCPACEAALPVAANSASEVTDAGTQYRVRSAQIEHISCWRCLLTLESQAELTALAISVEHEERERLGRILICRDCNCEFLFTARQEEFFLIRNFSPPRRCIACAKARRQTLRREFTIACSNCEKSTTVPFVPRLDEVTGLPVKPILCRECFDSRRI